MNAATRLSAGLLCLVLNGCAAGTKIADSQFSKDLQKSPLQPWYTHQVLSGDRENKIEYFGVRLTFGL